MRYKYVMPQWHSLYRAAILLGMFLLVPGLAGAGGISGLFKMSRAQEADIARKMHDEYARKPGLVGQGAAYDKVQRVGRRLVERNQLKEYPYEFFVVDDKDINAFATPGGYVYVNRGLVELLGYDEAMLAGIMGHELGHAKDRHVAKAYEKQMQGGVSLGVLGALLGNKSQSARLVNGLLQNAGGLMYLKYSRDQEEWADRAGVTLAYGAGYDAYGLPRSLQALAVLFGSSSKAQNYFENHPASKARVKRTLEIARDTSHKPQGYRAVPPPPSSKHPLWKLYGPQGSERAKFGKADTASADAPPAPASPAQIAAREDEGESVPVEVVEHR